MGKPFSMALQTARMMSSNSANTNQSIKSLKEISALKENMVTPLDKEKETESMGEKPYNGSLNNSPSIQKEGKKR